MSAATWPLRILLATAAAVSAFATTLANADDNARAEAAAIEDEAERLELEKFGPADPTKPSQGTP